MELTPLVTCTSAVIRIFIPGEEFVLRILEAFLQTKPFVSECALCQVRMAGTATGGEWKIFKLEAEEELRVEVNLVPPPICTSLGFPLLWKIWPIQENLDIKNQNQLSTPKFGHQNLLSTHQ